MPKKSLWNVRRRTPLHATKKQEIRNEGGRPKSNDLVIISKTYYLFLLSVEKGLHVFFNSSVSHREKTIRQYNAVLFLSTLQWIARKVVLFGKTQKIPQASWKYRENRRENRRIAYISKICRLKRNKSEGKSRKTLVQILKEYSAHACLSS